MRSGTAAGRRQSQSTPPTPLLIGYSGMTALYSIGSGCCLFSDVAFFAVKTVLIGLGLLPWRLHQLNDKAGNTLQVLLLKYLYFPRVFLFSATLYYFTTPQRPQLYFLLHYIWLLVTFIIKNMFIYDAVYYTTFHSSPDETNKTMGFGKYLKLAPHKWTTLNS